MPDRMHTLPRAIPPIQYVGGKRAKREREAKPCQGCGRLKSRYNNEALCSSCRSTLRASE